MDACILTVHGVRSQTAILQKMSITQLSNYHLGTWGRILFPSVTISNHMALQQDGDGSPSVVGKFHLVS